MRASVGGLTRSGLGHLASPRFARRTRPEPLQTLRESLQVARAGGMDFDSAWEPSVEGALTGYRGLPRHDWSRAIRETREVWRAAYVGEPNGRLERWAGVLALNGPPARGIELRDGTSVETAASRDRRFSI